MFNFLKKKESKNIDNSLSKIMALLIHAAKIDEMYTGKEKKIIKKAMIELGSKKETIDEELLKAEEMEQKSNQILDFTKEVKNLNEESKIKIVEILWNIIYSDSNSDIYENNLMRRLTGLLYINPKIVGDIKEKVIKNLK
ncbi:MAG: TerB family tellurite resistance protein [Pelagibacterales bacterium]|jgi:uncharacterized tellurite resistance protein B-like protein|nr:TerB family tellurite resistance protein [Pelagibacterales bacterium]